VHVHIRTDETSVSVNGNFKRNASKRNTDKSVVAGYEKSGECIQVILRSLPDDSY
jgi:hypothetical protein